MDEQRRGVWDLVWDTSSSPNRAVEASGAGTAAVFLQQPKWLLFKRVIQSTLGSVPELSLIWYLIRIQNDLFVTYKYNVQWGVPHEELLGIIVHRAFTWTSISSVFPQQECVNERTNSHRLFSFTVILDRMRDASTFSMRLIIFSHGAADDAAAS